MRHAKLGKVTSIVSLAALLAAAGMSSARAATPMSAAASATNEVLSSVELTPHIFEKTIITLPPLAPRESGLCGQAGLDPILPDTAGLHYHYEVRNNVVTAVADEGYEFDASITENMRKWILNPAYYSCPDPVAPSPVVPNPDMFIVHIDAPKFGRLCDPANEQIVLSDTTDKPYYYFIQNGKVIAREKTSDHIIQQDTISVWPIELSTEPCEIAAPVAKPVPPAAEEPDVSTGDDPASIVSASGEVNDISAAPVAASVAPVTESVPSMEAAVEDSTAAALPNELANTGMNWFAFGLCLIALSLGTGTVLWARGYFARG